MADNEDDAVVEAAENIISMAEMELRDNPESRGNLLAHQIRFAKAGLQRAGEILAFKSTIMDKSDSREIDAALRIIQGVMGILNDCARNAEKE